MQSHPCPVTPTLFSTSTCLADRGSKRNKSTFAGKSENLSKTATSCILTAQCVNERFLSQRLSLATMRGLALSSLLFWIAGCKATAPDCKCFPGDSCWPSDDEWDHLNSTVGGRLVATVPLGSPCHDPNYDAEECQRLQSEWLYSSVQ